MSVCGSVCIFHYFLKKCNNLFGYFAWTFGRYYPGGPKCIKLFSKLSLFPEELLWVIFCPFLCIISFLIFIYSLRTIQLLHSIFSQMFLVLIRGLLYYRNLFTASLPLLGAILRYFVTHLRYVFLLLRAVIFPILSYEILYRCFFVLLLQSMYKWKFHKSYPSAERGGGGGVARVCVILLGLFWVYYSTFTKT